MKLLSAEVDNIIRIKSGLEWEDAVGKSYDVWLSDLRYLAELADKVCGETENIVSDMRAVPFAELEESYKRLTGLFAEVGF